MGPQTSPVAFRKAQRAHHAADGETWVGADVAPTLNVHDLKGSDIRATTVIAETPPAYGPKDDVADPVSVNEHKTWTHEGNMFRTHNVVVRPGDPFSFKPSHYTRDQDGAPSPIMPPLSADADKGDQDAVIYQPNERVAGTVEATIGRSRGAGTPVPMLALDRLGVPPIAGTLGSSGGGPRGWNNDLDGSGAFPVEQIAPTVNGTQRQQVDGAMAVDPVGIPRRLMPIECERLQGWPDGWTNVAKRTILQSDADLFGGLTEVAYDVPADTKRYRAIGNGVATPVAQWIAWRIRIAAIRAYLSLTEPPREPHP